MYADTKKRLWRSLQIVMLSLKHDRNQHRSKYIYMLCLLWDGLTSRSVLDTNPWNHYRDVIMNAIVSQITGASIVYSTICAGADQGKHRSYPSQAFVMEIRLWPMNSQDKGLVTRKMLHLMTSSWCRYFRWYGTVWHVYEWQDILWPQGRINLLAYYTISLPSLGRFFRIASTLQDGLFLIRTPGIITGTSLGTRLCLNHRRLDCLLNHLCRRRSRKTSKLPVTGLCEGNSPVTDELPRQRASNKENAPFDDVIIMPVFSLIRDCLTCVRMAGYIMTAGSY